MVARTTLRALAATAATGLALAGCGASDDEPGSKQAAPAAAAATGPGIPPDLIGTYERRVTRADIARTAKLRAEAGPQQEAPAPGPVRLVITAMGLRFADLGVDPPFVIEQSITAGADRLSIESYVHPEQGSFCGPEIPQNAAYGWSRDGGGLRLDARDDPCADRDSLLTGSWKARP